MSALLQNPADARRKTDLAKIHLAKKQLGLSDDDYRALLVSVTGLSSAGALGPVQRAKLLHHFEKLGFKTGTKKTPTAATNGQQNTGRVRSKTFTPEAYTKQQRLVFVLWSQLHAQGVVHNNTEQSMNAWIKSETGVDHLRWLDSTQTRNVIDQLKAWAKSRAKKDSD